MAPLVLETLTGAGEAGLIPHWNASTKVSPGPISKRHVLGPNVATCEPGVHRRGVRLAIGFVMPGRQDTVLRMLCVEVTGEGLQGAHSRTSKEIEVGRDVG